MIFGWAEKRNFFFLKKSIFLKSNKFKHSLITDKSNIAMKNSPGSEFEQEL